MGETNGDDMQVEEVTKEDNLYEGRAARSPQMATSASHHSAELKDKDRDTGGDPEREAARLMGRMSLSERSVLIDKLDKSSLILMRPPEEATARHFKRMPYNDKRENLKYCFARSVEEARKVEEDNEAEEARSVQEQKTAEEPCRQRRPGRRNEAEEVTKAAEAGGQREACGESGLLEA